VRDAKIQRRPNLFGLRTKIRRRARVHQNTTIIQMSTDYLKQSTMVTINRRVFFRLARHVKNLDPFSLGITQLESWIHQSQSYQWQVRVCVCVFLLTIIYEKRHF
jgi:hypothetical protein